LLSSADSRVGAAHGSDASFLSRYSTVGLGIVFVACELLLYQLTLRQGEALPFVLWSVVVFAVLFALALILAPEDLVPKLCVTPAILFLGLITIGPFIYLLYISFFDVTVLNFRKEWTFIGLENYVRVITDSVVRQSLIRTVEYVLFAVGAELVLGMVLSLLLNWDFKGKGFFTTALVLPMMMTPIVVGIGWKYFMDYNTGFINTILNNIGLPRVPWLTSKPLPLVDQIPLIGDFLFKQLNFKWAMVSMVFIDVWQWTPFVILALIAALSSLPRAPFEAAIVDGASGWQIFRYVTLPQLRPTIMAVVLIRVMDAVKAFDTIWALFGNNISTRTLNISIYTFGLGMKNFGQGAALSVLTLILMTIVSRSVIRLLTGKR
jgi:multiple sugar transport system permease protein